jgi:hypothetical protein
VIEAVSRGNDIITYHLQMGNVDPMSWTDCFSDSLLEVGILPVVQMALLPLWSVLVARWLGSNLALKARTD